MAPGRRAVVLVPEEAEAHFREVVATALCEGRPPQPTPAGHATPAHGTPVHAAPDHADHATRTPDARIPHTAEEPA
ncbi:hypothetical protein [Streptomyces rishiriensis]|uniref:hypothetical protein n=1 Tax=Streptomyces rishiriensis TaxID=68264 RepID=UPI0037D18B9E